ncbi:MAG: hypothetical protein KC912_11905 [Proteobacteria bacterium]|nr:hypothetical protein [Pseudomonadota bacterium]
MRLLALLIVTLFCLTGEARAEEVAGCGEFEGLESTAFKSKLTDEQRTCLEDFVNSAEPHAATRASFVLITNAFMAGEQDTYAALLRRHLTLVNTTDADVAYMYAILLEQKSASPFERLRWVRVAIENRVQWAKQARVYRERMKRLYQMRIEAGLETLIIAEKRNNENPTTLNSERVASYRERAQYWTQVAAPCLVYDDCGPYWDVEVIEDDVCEDLETFDTPAKVGKLTEQEVSCLKGRWIRMPLGRSRVMGLLVSNADGSEDPAVWDHLLTWYHNETGQHEAGLALRHGRYLGKRGEVYASEVIRWSQIVVDQGPELTGKRHKGMLGEALVIRVKAQKQLVGVAKRTHDGAGSVETELQYSTARERHTSFVAELKDYCGGIASDCPDDWRSELP